MRKPFVYCALVCMAWLVSMHDASAAALQVSPIRLDLSGDRPAAAITLHNQGNVPLNAQVRVFAWSQSLDDDHLEPTSAIIASPPIVRIEPDGDQTVRIMRVDTAPLLREQSYRLLIDELPDASTEAGNGVHVQLRYSVPVFADAKNEHAPALSFKLERVRTSDGADGLMLRAANAADVHAQLSSVILDWPDGQSTTVSDGLLGYALPHTERRWRVPGALPNASNATLHAVIDGEPTTVRVSLEPSPDK
jgi:fimbrial chaperone protein